MRGGDCQVVTDDSRLLVVDSLDAIVDLVRRHPRVFLRYSPGPAADRQEQSHDYESGLDLPGLSVTVLTPEPWWTRPVVDWVARRVCKYDELLDESRYPWLLTGRVVGSGPDHEPLIRMAEPLARIGAEAVSEARRLYQERFQVSRSSQS